MSQTIASERQTIGSALGPGWHEIVSGIFAFVIVGFGGGALIVHSDLALPTVGLMLSALSGLSCLVGFAVAALIRLRSWEAFGVRAVPPRWLAIGAAAGLLAFVFKGLTTTADGLYPSHMWCTASRCVAMVDRDPPAEWQSGRSVIGRPL